MTFSAADLTGLAVLVLPFLLGVLTGALAVRIGTPDRKGNGGGGKAKDEVMALMKLLVEHAVRDLRTTQAADRASVPARRKWFSRR
jgi:hypothetical protein